MADKEDIPDVVKTALSEKADEWSIAELDEKLEALAVAQRIAGVRTVMLTVGANGDVDISYVYDRQGQSHVPYGRVDRLSNKLVKRR